MPRNTGGGHECKILQKVSFFVKFGNFRKIRKNDDFFEKNRKKKFAVRILQNDDFSMSKKWHFLTPIERAILP